MWNGSGMQPGDSRAPSAGFGRRVPVRRYIAGAGQDRAHDFALHSDAAAVNNADVPETQLMRLFQVGLHHSLHVARRYAVQVEDVGNRDANRFAGIRPVARHTISLYRRSALAAKYTYIQYRSLGGADYRSLCSANLAPTGRTTTKRSSAPHWLFGEY
jgi:hypothetical protein